MSQEQRPVIFGKRVFVAGENETDLTLITQLLEADRHEVAIAMSGMQSLEILSARNFDVMFIDVSMRDMDGATLLQIYRFGKIGAAPAFLLSAASPAETSAKCAATGAVGFLHKPVTSQAELRYAIAQVCEVGPAIALAPRSGSSPGRRGGATVKIVAPQFIDPLVIEGLKSVSANPEFLPMLLVVAAEDIGRISDDLVQALSSRDFGRIRDLAHALKGVAASVGAARLVALASQLMHANRAQQGPAMKRMVRDLAEASQASITALLDIAAGLGSHSGAGPQGKNAQQEWAATGRKSRND